MRRWLVWVIAVPLLLAGAIFVFDSRYGQPGPPGLLGSVLRIDDGNRGQVVALTQRLEYNIIPRRLGYYRGPTEYHIELVGIDAATMQRNWTRRLLTHSDDPLQDVTILGAEGGVVWLFVDQLLAVAAATGEPMLDLAGLESRNKELRGLMPTERQYYRFEDGLVVTTVDGRKHRITAPDFQARAEDGRKPQGAAASDPGVRKPAYYAPNSTHGFQEREIHFGQRWFGLLASEAEAEPLRSAPLRAGYDWISGIGGPPQRYRIWAGEAELVPATPSRPDQSGTYVRILDVQPLQGAPDFLNGGFLMDDGRRSPVRVSDPDSFIILHSDRLDEGARLRLTRLDFTGRVLWIAALPLSVLQSVLPGPETLALRGVQFQPADPNRRRDPLHTAISLLVSVDLRSGAVRGYDFGQDAPFSLQ